jgi:hypothetical protein
MPNQTLLDHAKSKVAQTHDNYQAILKAIDQIADIDFSTSTDEDVARFLEVIEKVQRHSEDGKAMATMLALLLPVMMHNEEGVDDPA